MLRNNLRNGTFRGERNATRGVMEEHHVGQHCRRLAGTAEPVLPITPPLACRTESYGSAVEARHRRRPYRRQGAAFRSRGSTPGNGRRGRGCVFTAECDCGRAEPLGANRRRSEGHRLPRDCRHVPRTRRAAQLWLAAGAFAGGDCCGNCLSAAAGRILNDNAPAIEPGAKAASSLRNYPSGPHARV